MQLARIISAAEIGAGTLILAFGLVVAGVSASAESFEGVFLGFLCAIIGYKLNQYSVRDRPQISLDSVSSKVLSAGRLLHLFMVLVGIGTIAYGFIRIFTSMREASIELAFAATIILFVGYAITHYGVNNSLV